jgi:predicted TIM-barrel fold metal-dependent hydrolase
MTFPSDVGVIDLMIGIPEGSKKSWYGFLRAGLMDDESKEMAFPAQYMFKDVPKDVDPDADPIAVVLGEMDHFGIERGMIGIGLDRSVSIRALTEHPDRFFGSYEANPNLGMEGVRNLVRAYEEYGIKAATAFPAGTNPQVPINDKRYYPLYAKCVELDIPICINGGIVGPRMPSWPQHVEHFDEVLYDFPDLTMVMMHGGEPWTALAVKLMLKWPGLHYSTSAWAPKYYPESIIKFANTRGADKIIYAGYFPMGLSLQRIMTDMPGVGFKDEVWPKFLRGNAMRVLGLDK